MTDQEAHMARIGFIGLGNMGLPMAANLVKAGHEVAGFDLVHSLAGKLTASGGGGAANTPPPRRRAGASTTPLPRNGQRGRAACAPPGGRRMAARAGAPP